MLVQATRTLSTWVLRALFYALLFLVVVIVHVALTSALRRSGWNGGLSLLVSGAVVLALVLFLVQLADWTRQWQQERRELQRARLKLPSGPTCVLWTPSPQTESSSSMPWEVIGPMRARYPGLPRRLGIEGYAIAEFEVSAEGRAKNIHVVDAWPSDVFFSAAKEALLNARFQLNVDEHPRFGATYRMPFVFRLRGTSRLNEKGAHARTLRPILQGGRRLVENLADAARNRTGSR
jgi:TonB family protein